MNDLNLRILRRLPDQPPRALVLAVTEPGEADALFALTSAGVPGPWALIAVSGIDWNRDLSPWPAPAAFRGGEPFGGGAEAFLRALTSEALPGARAALDAPSAPCFLAGYSLAGLFALWSLFQTDAFAGAVSASGSLWFPGFADFADTHAPLGRPSVYLSLGDREALTRNPVTRTVARETERVHARFAALGLRTTFAWNPGNHFADPTARLGKGIVWIMNNGQG